MGYSKHTWSNITVSIKMFTNFIYSMTFDTNYNSILKKLLNLLATDIDKNYI